MRKYDKRIELNWFEKLVEKMRLKNEIKELERTIKQKEKKTRGNLLNYKRSGIPVLQMNVFYKRMELEKLKGAVVEDRVRKVRSDRGKKRGARLDSKKNTRQLEEAFKKLV